MPFIYRNRELNSLGDKGWYTREINLFKNLIDHVDSTGALVVSANYVPVSDGTNYINSGITNDSSAMNLVSSAILLKGNTDSTKTQVSVAGAGDGEHIRLCVDNNNDFAGTLTVDMTGNVLALSSIGSSNFVTIDSGAVIATAGVQIYLQAGSSSVDVGTDLNVSSGNILYLTGNSGINVSSFDAIDATGKSIALRTSAGNADTTVLMDANHINIMNNDTVNSILKTIDMEGANLNISAIDGTATFRGGVSGASRVIAQIGSLFLGNASSVTMEFITTDIPSGKQDLLSTNAFWCDTTAINDINQVAGGTQRRNATLDINDTANRHMYLTAANSTSEMILLGQKKLTLSSNSTDGTIIIQAGPSTSQTINRNEISFSGTNIDANCSYYDASALSVMNLVSSAILLKGNTDSTKTQVTIAGASVGEHINLLVDNNNSGAGRLAIDMTANILSLSSIGSSNFVTLDSGAIYVTAGNFVELHGGSTLIYLNTNDGSINLAASNIDSTCTTYATTADTSLTLSSHRIDMTGTSDGTVLLNARHVGVAMTNPQYQFDTSGIGRFRNIAGVAQTSGSSQPYMGLRVQEMTDSGQACFDVGIYDGGGSNQIIWLQASKADDLSVPKGMMLNPTGGPVGINCNPDPSPKFSLDVGGYIKMPGSSLFPALDLDLSGTSSYALDMDNTNVHPYSTYRITDATSGGVSITVSNGDEGDFLEIFNDQTNGVISVYYDTGYFIMGLAPDVIGLRNYQTGGGPGQWVRIYSATN